MKKDFSGVLGFAAVLVAALLIWKFILPGRDHFVPEFLDQGNVKQTDKTGTSSYAQETNHFKLTPPMPEPIPGVQSPFRVNMHTAYIV